MFDFDSSSLNRSRWLLDGIAIVDIYAAWYMLLSINPNLPKVDPILAKIYFSEYGVNTDGLTDTAVMTMATEYDSKIRVFYRKCIVQRLVDIIERFAKICYDPRLPHRITLPVVTRPHFEGIVRSQEPAVIIERRKEFIGDLAQIVAEIHEKLSGGRENLIISYEPNCDASELGERIKDSRSIARTLLHTWR